MFLPSPSWLRYVRGRDAFNGKDLWWNMDLSGWGGVAGFAVAFAVLVLACTRILRRATGTERKRGRERPFPAGPSPRFPHAGTSRHAHGVPPLTRGAGLAGEGAEVPDVSDLDHGVITPFDVVRKVFPSSRDKPADRSPSPCRLAGRSRPPFGRYGVRPPGPRTGCRTSWRLPSAPSRGMIWFRPAGRAVREKTLRGELGCR